MFPERFSATFPAGEGNDLAGVVTAVGPDVSQFSVGDEVLGFSLRRDSHATHTAVPVAQLIPKPAQLSWEIAGSLFVVGVTAVRAVAPQPDVTIAVSAAAGGVGSLVVQPTRLSLEAIFKPVSLSQHPVGGPWCACLAS